VPRDILVPLGSSKKYFLKDEQDLFIFHTRLSIDWYRSEQKTDEAVHSTWLPPQIAVVEEAAVVALAGTLLILLVVLVEAVSSKDSSSTITSS
jgi:hypothetical protein